MSRDRTVNGEFVQALRTVYSQSVGETVVKSLLFALGVDTSLDASWEQQAAKFPVTGFYLHAGGEMFVAYVVTPERFIRYEAASGEDLTIVVPLSRICRVETRTTKDAMLHVRVELDADNPTVLNEYRQGYGEDDHEDTIYGQMRGQIMRPAYELQEPMVSEPGTQLREFGRALRSTIGT